MKFKYNNEGVAQPVANAPVDGFANNAIVSTDNEGNLTNPSYIAINPTANIGSATANLGVTITESGVYAYGNIWQQSNTTDSNAKFDVRVGGGSAGDPYYACDIDGVGGWSFGIDNSDNDKFKIDRGGPPSPGNDTKFSIDTDGNVSIPSGNLNVSGTISSAGVTATKVNIANSVTNAAFLVPFVASTGAQDVYTNSNLEFNPSTQHLTLSGSFQTHFDVVSTGEAAITLSRVSSSNYAQQHFYTTTTNMWAIGLRSGDDNFHVFDAVNGAEAMIITPGSNPAFNFLGPVSVSSGDVAINTAGKTLKIKQGSNACAGVGATMVGGTVTVNTTAVNTGDIVLLTKTAAGGTSGLGMPVISIVNGTSFTITGDATDMSTWSWLIIKAA